MAKSGATSTTSPLAFSMCRDILADGAGLRLLARTQNWAHAERRICHLSLAAGPDGWDDYSGGAGTAVGTLSVTVTGSAVTIVDTDIWIDEETAVSGALRGGVEAHCTTGSENVRTIFTITGSLGSRTITLDCTTTNNDTEVSGTTGLTPVTNGGEWCRVQVSVQRTSGSALDHELRALRLEEEVLTTSSLPDPLDD